jgi:hypothetical protein
MIKTIAEFTTSKGNEIEIYTIVENNDSPIKSCIVFDKSCLLERTYWIGKDAYLNWEQLENGYKPVKSIQQVVDAWRNEEIHF